MGFILFIMSEVMFFSAWFWTFFKHAIFPPVTDWAGLMVSTGGLSIRPRKRRA